MIWSLRFNFVLRCVCVWEGGIYPIDLRNVYPLENLKNIETGLQSMVIAVCGSLRNLCFAWCSHV